MKPIPSEVVARWSPMWAKDCCSERPWWRSHGMTYRRCDGIGLYSQWTLDQRGGDPRGLWDGKEPYEDAMARIDAAHPLPTPEPQVGQVWMTVGVEWKDYPATYVDDEEMVVSRIRWTGNKGQKRRLRYVWFSHVSPRQDVWPPPGAILVAGPTPWGQNCPWSPT